MDSKRNDTQFKKWIFVLAVLLILINSFFFIVYVETYSWQSPWKQIWEYFGSDVFKIFTISLIVPLILFVLEKYFKIIDSFKQNQEEKTKIRREELKNKRLETMDKTFDSWNQLFKLANEIIFLDPETNGLTEKINKVLRKLSNLVNPTEEVMNRWTEVFTHIENKHITVLVAIINVMENSINTVCHVIKNTENKVEIKEQQNNLLIITEGINYVVHHHVINFFKYSIQYMEKDEELALDPDNKTIREELKVIEDNFNYAYEYLDYWATPIMKVVIENIDILTHEEKKNNEDYEDFKKPFKELADWAAENPGKGLNKAGDEWDSFYNKYEKVPIDTFKNIVSTPHDKEYVNSIAKSLTFILVQKRLIERSNWIKKI